MERLREEGWTVEKTERWNPFAHVRQDLFGIADAMAVKAYQSPLFIQATHDRTGKGEGEKFHREKLEANPRFQVVKLAGIRVEIHAWKKVGERGKRKTWQLRRIEV